MSFDPTDSPPPLQATKLRVVPLPLFHPPVHAVPGSMPTASIYLPTKPHDFLQNPHGLHLKPLKKLPDPSPHVATRQDALTHRICLRKRPNEEILNLFHRQAGFKPNGRQTNSKAAACIFRWTSNRSPSYWDFFSLFHLLRIRADSFRHESRKRLCLLASLFLRRLVNTLPIQPPREFHTGPIDEPPK